MKTTAIINLKGGVGKSVTAINLAYTLAHLYKKRVLLVDCDKQGNSSKFFGRHDYDQKSLSDVLTQRGFETIDAIFKTPYKILDILPANMTLLRADREILMDCTRPQQSRMKRELDQVSKSYDYCIIDCAPDLSMSVINAMVACDNVIIPIKVDKFAFDGVAQILEQIEEIKEFNPQIKVLGGLVTMYANNNINNQGIGYLSKKEGLPMLTTVIRKTVAVDESTFIGQPLLAWKRKSTAALDYMELAREYLGEME